MKERNEDTLIGSGTVIFFTYSLKKDLEKQTIGWVPADGSGPPPIYLTEDGRGSRRSVTAGSEDPER
jgi:hypothetical protein